MRRIPFLLTIVVATTLARPGAASAQITVSFNPSNITIAPNQVVNVDIVANIPVPVVGFGLDIFPVPPQRLSAMNLVSVANPFVNAPAFDEPGILDISAFAPPSGVITLAPAPIATISIKGGAPGSADLMLGATAGDWTEGFPLLPFGFANIIFNKARIKVTPEPATLCLVPLAALWATRRRR